MENEELGWGRTWLILCASRSWQLLQTPAELHFSLLRPNLPWDVQEESPEAQGGGGGTARAAAAAHLQHSWLSIPASAGANWK